MACKGVAMIGYLHQPVWTKLQTFPGFTGHGFFSQPNFNFNNSFKLRKVSHVEGGNFGWNPSFLSFSVPQFGVLGEGRSFPNYGFTEVDSEADESEIPFDERVLAAFHLDCNKWGVSVKPLAGTVINFAVYISILKLGDRIMYLNLTHKGHLSHDFASQYFEIMPYRLDESTDLIGLEKTAAEFRPKLIVASVYPPDIDYSRIRKIADEVGAFFMMDMTHILGFVAESVLADPFEFCDIVATATLKSIRGPGGGMIFFKKSSVHGVDLESAIDNNCFPDMEGGPRNHTIGGQTICFKDEQSPDFKIYQKQVVANCIALANRLVEHGYKLVSGGNDNHMVLVDLGQFGIDGALVEKILNMAFINVNKNLVSGDKNALVSNGISIGTKAMTTRGFNEKEFELFADLIHEGVLLSFEAKSLVLGSTDQDFMNVLISPEFSLGDKVSDLRRKVQALAPSSRSKMFGYGLRFYEFCDIA